MTQELITLAKSEYRRITERLLKTTEIDTCISVWDTSLLFVTILSLQPSLKLYFKLYIIYK